MNGIFLITTKTHQHQAGAEGVRLTRTDYLQTPLGVRAVEFWAHWETGRMAEIKAPRELRSGELTEAFR
jgi:hypothetical protein